MLNISVLVDLATPVVTGGTSKNILIIGRIKNDMFIETQFELLLSQEHIRRRQAIAVTILVPMQKCLWDHHSN